MDTESTFASQSDAQHGSFEAAKRQPRWSGNEKWKLVPKQNLSSRNYLKLGANSTTPAPSETTMVAIKQIIEILSVEKIKIKRANPNDVIAKMSAFAPLFCYRSHGRAPNAPLKLHHCGRDAICVHKVKLERRGNTLEVLERIVGCQTVSQNVSRTNELSNQTHKCILDYFDTSEPTIPIKFRHFSVRHRGRLGNGYQIKYKQKQGSNTVFFKKCCRMTGCNKDILIPLEYHSHGEELYDALYVHEKVLLVFFTVALVDIAILVIWIFRTWTFHIKYHQRCEVLTYEEMEHELADSYMPVKQVISEQFLSGLIPLERILATILAFEDYRLQDSKTKVDTLDMSANVQKLRWNMSIYYRCKGYGHRIARCTHEKNTHLDGILMQLLEFGPYLCDLKPLELVELFDQAREAFAADPPEVEIYGNVVVVGDLRGRYGDLWRWLQLVGFPPNQKLLFLGGVLEEDEIGSLECITFIAAMKVAQPQNIFMLRGIGESNRFRPQYRFRDRPAEAVGDSIKRMCAQMPISATINGQIFCSYSGVPLRDPEDVLDFERPCAGPRMPDVYQELVYGSPKEQLSPEERRQSLVQWLPKVALLQVPACYIRNFFLMDSGPRLVYDKADVMKLLGRKDVELFVRARNRVSSGFNFSFNAQMLTLWSTSFKSKKASVLQVSQSNQLTLHTFCVQHRAGKRKSKLFNAKNSSVGMVSSTRAVSGRSTQRTSNQRPPTTMTQSIAAQPNK